MTNHDDDPQPVGVLFLFLYFSPKNPVRTVTGTIGALPCFHIPLAGVTFIRMDGWMPTWVDPVVGMRKMTKLIFLWFAVSGQ